MKHARITASVCCANRIALSFSGILHDRVFFLNNFADFSNVVRVKKNQDFVQPLVTFPISNISSGGPEMIA